MSLTSSTIYNTAQYANNPTTQKWKQDDQKFKVILGYYYTVLGLPTLQQAQHRHKTKQNKNLKRIVPVVVLTKAVHPGQHSPWTELVMYKVTDEKTTLTSA